MDQIEVEIVETQFLHRYIESFQRIVIAVVLDPELGRDEEVFPGDAAFFDGGSDAFFIAVGSNRIDQAVAQFQGRTDGFFCFCGFRLIDAVTKHRHFNAVI